MKEKPHWIVWVQTAGFIVAVISIAFNIYQYVNREAEKGIAAAKVLRLTEQLYQSEIREQAARERMAEYDVEIEQVEAEKKQHRIRADHFRREAERNAAMVEHFKQQLNEKPIFPDMSDDEHLLFFLEWTGRSPRQ